MDIINQISDTNVLDNNRGYWFIRTDSGQYFETYINNNFIGIGWDFITVYDLVNSPFGYEVKAKIAKNLGYDLNTKKGKSKATSVYNKLNKFRNLNKGDVVVIPSNSSSQLAFGIIDDNAIYVDQNKNFSCEYQKRRRVQWIEVKHMHKLDPKFFQITVSQHAISDIKKYENYIDNVTNSLYYKGDFGHFVLDIKTEGEINVNTFLDLVDSIQKLIKDINSNFDLNEDIDSSSIKLNLQSPGKIEFKLRNGRSLAILASILILTSCSSSSGHPTTLKEGDQQKIYEFVEIHKDSLQRLDRVLDELKIDKERINKIQ